MTLALVLLVIGIGLSESYKIGLGRYDVNSLTKH